MLFKSGIVTQISGSIGGLTGSHNIGGMYFRGRGIPVNPDSARQQNARAGLTNAVNRWTDVLTPGNRNTWRNYAAATPTIGPLGDSRSVSGQNMYIASQSLVANLNAQLATALPNLTGGPGINNLGDYTPVAIAYTTGTSVELTFDANDDWANEDDSVMIVQGGAFGVNTSRNFFKGPWQLRAVIAGDATTPPTSPATINLNPFWTAGQKTYCRVRVLRADGRLSAPQILSAIRT